MAVDLVTFLFDMVLAVWAIGPIVARNLRWEYLTASRLPAGKGKNGWAWTLGVVAMSIISIVGLVCGTLGAILAVHQVVVIPVIGLWWQASMILHFITIAIFQLFVHFLFFGEEWYWDFVGMVVLFVAWLSSLATMIVLFYAGKLGEISGILHNHYLPGYWYIGYVAAITFDFIAVVVWVIVMHWTGIKEKVRHHGEKKDYHYY